MVDVTLAGVPDPHGLWYAEPIEPAAAPQVDVGATCGNRDDDRTPESIGEDPYQGDPREMESTSRRSKGHFDPEKEKRRRKYK